MEAILLLGLIGIAILGAIFLILYILAHALLFFFDWPNNDLSEEEMIRRYFSRTKLGEMAGKK